VHHRVHRTVNMISIKYQAHIQHSKLEITKVPHTLQTVKFNHYDFIFQHWPGRHPQLIQYARSIDFLFIEGSFKIYYF